MGELLCRGIPFAQRSRLEGFRRGFRGQPLDAGDLVLGLLIVGGLIAAVWLLSYLLTLKEHRRSYSSSLGLFVSLCRAHRLDWGEWWLLWRVARAQQLSDPARLFLEPERLQPANLGPTFQARSTQLDELRERLFVWPEEAESQPAPRHPKSPGVREAGTPLPPVTPTPVLDFPPRPPPSAAD